MMWFNLKVSFLKKISVNAVKTIKVITSCITLSCHKLKGPPFSLKPILFAGTCAEYSKSAIPQLMRTIVGSPNLLNQVISLNFKCPYQAKVMKMFDRIRSNIV